MTTGSYCAYCGSKVEPNSKFCSNCGKPTSLPATPPTTVASMSSSNNIVNKKTNKKVIVGIVVITLLVAIGAVYAAINNGNTQHTVINNGSNQTQQTEDRIASLLGNNPERINDPQWRQVATDIIRTENMDNALLVIYSTTSWSAVVEDSDFVQRTVDGSGSRSIEFECGGFGGIFSHVVQKQTDYGVLNAYVAQKGHIIKQASTGAAYGVVSMAGNCA